MLPGILVLTLSLADKGITVGQPVCYGRGACYESDSNPSDNINQMGSCLCEQGYAGIDTAGKTTCGDCEPGTRSTPGYYGGQSTLDSVTLQCLLCPGGGTCSGHGSCSVGARGNGTCTCDLGFAGSDCGTTLPCSPGQAKLSGNSTCHKCTFGHINPLGQGTSCSVCDAGRYATGGSTACVACAAGQSGAAAGAAECSNCTAGHTSAVAGLATCVPCDAGKHSDTMRTVCIACSAGQYADRFMAGDTVCGMCSLGHFSASAMSAGCTACAEGRVQQLMEAQPVTPVQQGRFPHSRGYQHALPVAQAR